MTVVPIPTAISIDSIADAALARARDEGTARACDACGGVIEGEPASRGLFLTTRGDEVRYEEPSLCGACALAIGLKIRGEAEIEEEEDG